MGNYEREIEYSVVGEVTEGDLLRLGRGLGTKVEPVARLRPSHQEAARLMAAGVDIQEVAMMTGYQVARLYTLRQDPMFQECLAYYEDVQKGEFFDVIGKMRQLGLDFVDELQKRLQDQPERFTADELMRAIALLADRSGFGPKSTVQHQHAIPQHVLSAMKELVDRRERENVVVVDARQEENEDGN